MVCDSFDAQVPRRTRAISIMHVSPEADAELSGSGKRYAGAEPSQAPLARPQANDESRDLNLHCGSLFQASMLASRPLASQRSTNKAS